jgi:hypothetical protein
MNSQFQQQLQYSPTISHSSRSSPPEKSRHPNSSPTSSINSSTKDLFQNDHPTKTDYYSSSSTPPTTHPYPRPRSPTMTPNNFIRIHFPNKHTTAVNIF